MASRFERPLNKTCRCREKSFHKYDLLLIFLRKEKRKKEKEKENNKIIKKKVSRKINKIGGNKKVSC